MIPLRRIAVLAIGLLAALQAGSRVPSVAEAVSEAPALCFAPDTAPEVVEKAQARLYNVWGKRDPFASGPFFQNTSGNRWTSTASQVGPLVQGDPTILTWSVIPDGTPMPGSNGEPANPSNLIARFNGIYGSQATWIALFQQTFAEWGALTGNTYIFEPNDDGATFQSSPGVLGVRGDIRIGGHLLDGNSNLLAYNFFPNNGDMVLDTADNFYDNISNNSLRLRNTMAHEHGHGLGFRHNCPANQTKLMEPFISTAYDGPQHDDTLAGQRFYGDPRETNDTTGAATDLGALGNGTVTRNGLSVDGTTDVDFLKFTVPAGKMINVTMTPVGFTYLQGPQNNDGSCPAGTTFNSGILNKLGLDVRAPNGTTVLATANSQPIGMPETLTNVVLGAAGTYFVRVFPGATNQVQLYNLSLTVNDSTITDLAITNSDGQVTASPGQVLTYTITASNPAGATQMMVTGATVTDTVPASLTGVTWTCVGAGGGTCGAPAGAGNINQTANLPVGGSVTYTLIGTVSATPTTTLLNTATVAVPVTMSDPNPGNNTATDSDFLLCGGESVAVADGRLTSATVGAGATVWHGSILKIGDSYSWELKSLTGTTAPGTATFYAGDDGCSLTSTLTTRDTTALDPGGSATTRRVSFVATGTAPFFRARLVNSGGSIPYSFSVTDTTLYSPAWSTNGTFDTFYSFQNTTGAAVTGTLTLLDTAGAVLNSFPVSVPAGQTSSTNTLSLAVARNRTGTARFAHDGPPGAVLAEAAIANFSITPNYIQPVKFQTVREAR
jgi:uncharacterized repeat protein (TIGR01451 family)